MAMHMNPMGTAAALQLSRRSCLFQVAEGSRRFVVEFVDNALEDILRSRDNILTLRGSFREAETPRWTIVSSQPLSTPGPDVDTPPAGEPDTPDLVGIALSE